MCEIAEQRYDGVLNNLESMESDNPMRQSVAAYRSSRGLKVANGQPSYVINEG